MRMMLLEVADGHYLAKDGRTMQREHGLTPNGNQLNDCWVLRDPEGKFLGFNRYRNDLAEAYGLDIGLGGRHVSL